MCGIAGILLPPEGVVDASLLAAMSRCLAHRGPDGEGFLGWDGSGTPAPAPRAGDLPPCRVALAHRRLAVIDLSPAAAQPMLSPDGRLAIVFNGMIYNYRPLREELRALGWQFRTQSDTEVLLAAIAHWGQDCLRRLVGMFALGVLDTRRRELFLARDFFGIKPLYYAHWQGGLAFASEIKALLELPHLPRRADAGRVFQFLRFGHSDSGQNTFIESIRQLPPAHCMTVPLDRPAEARPVQYWRLDTSARAELSFDEAARRLREMFAQSVQMHLQSDVPLGVALSGGMDSSALAMAAGEAVGRSRPLKTFTFVAAGRDLGEEHFADLVIGRSGATAHKIHQNDAGRIRTDASATGSPGDFLEDLEAVLQSQDEPFGSTSIFAQCRVFPRRRGRA